MISTTRKRIRKLDRERSASVVIRNNGLMSSDLAVPTAAVFDISVGGDLFIAFNRNLTPVAIGSSAGMTIVIGNNFYTINGNYEVFDNIFHANLAIGANHLDTDHVTYDGSDSALKDDLGRAVPAFTIAITAGDAIELFVPDSIVYNPNLHTLTLEYPFTIIEGSGIAATGMSGRYNGYALAFGASTYAVVGRTVTYSGVTAGSRVGVTSTLTYDGSDDNLRRALTLGLLGSYTNQPLSGIVPIFISYTRNTGKIEVDFNGDVFNISGEATTGMTAENSSHNLIFKGTVSRFPGFTDSWLITKTEIDKDRLRGFGNTHSYDGLNPNLKDAAGLAIPAWAAFPMGPTSAYLPLKPRTIDYNPNTAILRVEFDDNGFAIDTTFLPTTIFGFSGRANNRALVFGTSFPTDYAERDPTNPLRLIYHHVLLGAADSGSDILEYDGTQGTTFRDTKPTAVQGFWQESMTIASVSASVNSHGPYTVTGSPITLAGTQSGCDSVRWTTSGDGSFNNATLLAAVYTPGAVDQVSGCTLELTGIVGGLTIAFSDAVLAVPDPAIPTAIALDLAAGTVTITMSRNLTANPSLDTSGDYSGRTSTNALLFGLSSGVISGNTVTISGISLDVSGSAASGDKFAYDGFNDVAFKDDLGRSVPAWTDFTMTVTPALGTGLSATWDAIGGQLFVDLSSYINDPGDTALDKTKYDARFSNLALVPGDGIILQDGSPRISDDSATVGGADVGSNRFRYLGGDAALVDQYSRALLAFTVALTAA